MTTTYFISADGVLPLDESLVKIQTDHANTLRPEGADDGWARIQESLREDETWILSCGAHGNGD